MKSDNKYKWHDLRKDPNDLPESEEVRLLAYDDIFKLPCITDGKTVIHCNVILAWRYIEPLEEIELFGKTEQLMGEEDDT